MLKVDETWLSRVEKVYPGIRESIRHFEELNLPSCPACASKDTAAVSAGIVGRSIHVAAATTKIRLLPNVVPGDYFCNTCREYFGIEESAMEAEQEAGSLLLDPRAATEDDLERFVRALRTQGVKSDRIARRSEEEAGR